MSHPVVDFQILSTSLDETANSYTERFGWTVSGNNPFNYRRLDTGTTEGIRGGIWPAPPEARSFVQLFSAVDNVAASVARAVGLGARALIPPTKPPEGGEMAVLLDPLGLSFAVRSR
jgi:uncharacterized protein